MSNIKIAHYTNFGASCQPREADTEGYLHYRADYQAKIPPEDWTPAELWIDEQETRIAIALSDAWRNKQ